MSGDVFVGRLGEGAVQFFASAVGDPSTAPALLGGVILSVLLLALLEGREGTIMLGGDSLRTPSARTDTSTPGSNDVEGPRQNDLFHDTERETTDSRTAESARTATAKSDRVRSLLKREGGTIRQSRIVEETGWSKTKVSRHLSAMADDGAIVKIQIGRENLICLPGHVPSAADEEDD